MASMAAAAPAASGGDEQSGGGEEKQAEAEEEEEEVRHTRGVCFLLGIMWNKYDQHLILCDFPLFWVCRRWVRCSLFGAFLPKCVFHTHLCTVLCSACRV